jgi:hypothetical protein
MKAEFESNILHHMHNVAVKTGGVQKLAYDGP